MKAPVEEHAAAAEGRDASAHRKYQIGGRVHIADEGEGRGQLPPNTV
jgi:hypothetical protein